MNEFRALHVAPRVLRCQSIPRSSCLSLLSSHFYAHPAAERQEFTRQKAESRLHRSSLITQLKVSAQDDIEPGSYEITVTLPKVAEIAKQIQSESSAHRNISASLTQLPCTFNLCQIFLV
jgi:hypothetical protein